MKDDMINNFQSIIVVVMSIQGFNFLLRFAIMIFLARNLGLQGRGEFSLILLIPSLFHAVIYMGIGEANTYLIGKGKHDHKLIAGCSNTIAVIFIAGATIVYFAFYELLLSLLKGNISENLYLWAYPIIPITLIWSYWSSNLLGLGVIKEVNLGRLVNNIFFLAVSIVFIVFLKFNVLGAIYGYVIGQTVELIYIGYHLRKRLPIRLAWNTTIIKEQLSFGYKNALGGFFDHLNSRMDIYFVNWFLGAKALGSYTVAVGFSSLLLNIPHVFSGPVISLAATSKNQDGWAVTAHGTKQSLLLMLPAAILIFIFSTHLTRILYSDDFLAAANPARMLLPGIIALGLARVLVNGLAGYGEIFEWTKASFWGMIVTIILDILLIPKMGIFGASLASSSAYILITILILFAFQRHSGLKISAALIPQRGELKSYATSLRELSKNFWKKLI